MAKKGGVIKTVIGEAAEIVKDVVKEGGKELFGEGLKENIDIALGWERRNGDENKDKEKKRLEELTKADNKDRGLKIEAERRLLSQMQQEEQQTAFKRERKEQEELMREQKGKEQKETGKAFVFPIVRLPSSVNKQPGLFKKKRQQEPVSIERKDKKAA